MYDIWYHACSLTVITHVSVICLGLTDGPSDRLADPSHGTNLGATVQGVALDSVLEAVE